MAENVPGKADETLSLINAKDLSECKEGGLGTVNHC